MTTTPDLAATGLPRPAPRRAAAQIFAQAWALNRMKLGVVITGLVLFVALAGPLLAPHGEADMISAPYRPPSATALLGTDYLGRDVVSRVLHGGQTVVLLSVIATVLGVLGGTVLGLVAGYARGRLDSIAMFCCDVLLAFPQIVLVLVGVAMVGPRGDMLALLVALTHLPRIARLARSLTADIAEREFVQSARLMGIPHRRILLLEILPNIITPLLVETALRLTWSIGLIAGLGFLGYGIQPPTADWGLMINENRNGLIIQVWAVAAPALMVFLFTVGTNLIAEAGTRVVARTSPES